MQNLLLLHVFSAFLSLLLLMIRGAMQLNGKDWRAVKLLKILPHCVDTLLLATGLLIMLLFGYALQIWLITKFLLLVLYAVFSAKYFSKKASQPNTLFLLLALISFSGAIWLGYHH